MSELIIKKIDSKTYFLSYPPWERTVVFSEEIKEDGTIIKIKLPGRPTRIINAFIERNICPEGKSLLLIGYGNEDYISPYNNKVKNVMLMDVSDTSSNSSMYIQSEACNVNKHSECSPSLKA